MQDAATYETYRTMLEAQVERMEGRLAVGGDMADAP